MSARCSLRACFTLLVCLMAATPVLPAAAAESYMRIVYSDYPTTKSSEPIPGQDEIKFYSNELDFEAGRRWEVGGNGSTAWVRLLYGWLVLDYLEADEEEDLPRFEKTIYSELEANYRARGASPWGWQARVAPGWSSGQFDPAPSRDSTVRGGLWGLRSLSGGWLVGLGAVHTYVYGTPGYSPSLIAEYVGGNLAIEAELPRFADVTYCASERVDLGLVYEVRGHFYARDEAEFPDLSEPFVAHSAATLAGAMGYRFDSDLYLRLEGGYLLERALRLTDGTKEVMALDPKEGWFLRGILEWGGGWRGTPKLR